MYLYISFLLFSDIFLESLTDPKCMLSLKERRTEAATIGPAIEPLPTSSAPITNWLGLLFHISFSII